MESRSINIESLEQNIGQVDGLPGNPRQWTRTDLDKLKRSIEETPELLEARGLIVYPYDDQYIVIGGNMRLAALREMGAKDAPCIVLPEDTTIDKLKELVIKDNGAFGQNDWDALANEWSDLPLAEWGISAWNTETEEAQEEQEVKEDDFDESEDKVETRCVKGDIWLIGDHRLMCGDSTSEEDVKKLLDNELADLWLTDPPYNVALDEGSASELRQRRRRTDGLKIMNDKMEDSDFREFLRGAYSAAKSVMKDGAVYYIWHADKESYNFRGALRDVGGMQLRQTLIWVKDYLTLGRQDYQWIHEPCLYGWKEGEGHKWYNDRKQSTCLNFPRPKKSVEHPTMKPIELFAYQIKNSTGKGDIVLDSFGGSGTTMIACEQLGRKCYMMELDPHYCDVIIARWEKLTGREARKIE